MADVESVRIFQAVAEGAIEADVRGPDQAGGEDLRTLAEEAPGDERSLLLAGAGLGFALEVFARRHAELAPVDIGLRIQPLPVWLVMHDEVKGLAEALVRLLRPGP